MNIQVPDISAELVSRLIEQQFPEWAEEDVVAVQSSGTAHAMFRLGASKAVRLPRVGRAVGQIEKEHRWVPMLAQHVPLRVALPLSTGIPAYGFPWTWGVYSWLDGEDAASAAVVDRAVLVDRIAEFVDALRQVDPTGGPPPGEHNFGRGVPLMTRDRVTREQLDPVSDEFDPVALERIWSESLRASDRSVDSVWIHGDLHDSNLIVSDGVVSGVIDFGGLAVGDPACELAFAWISLSQHERVRFRELLGIDDDTWSRARGWALSIALIALPYYREDNRNRLTANRARRTIREVLCDFC